MCSWSWITPTTCVMSVLACFLSLHVCMCVCEVNNLWLLCHPPTFFAFLVRLTVHFFAPIYPLLWHIWIFSHIHVPFLKFCGIKTAISSLLCLPAGLRCQRIGVRSKTSVYSIFQESRTQLQWRKQEDNSPYPSSLYTHIYTQSHVHIYVHRYTRLTQVLSGKTGSASHASNCVTSIHICCCHRIPLCYCVYVCLVGQ